MKKKIYSKLSELVFLPVAMVLIMVTSCTNPSRTDYTAWVDPMIGTGGHGHTFPGATVPFGMVQISPDTRWEDWDGSSGYHYSDKKILIFFATWFFTVIFLIIFTYKLFFLVITPVMIFQSLTLLISILTSIVGISVCVGS